MQCFFENVKHWAIFVNATWALDVSEIVGSVYTTVLPSDTRVQMKIDCIVIKKKAF